MKGKSIRVACILVITALLVAQVTFAADDPALSTIAPTTDILAPLDTILIQKTVIVAGSDKGTVFDATASAKIIAYEMPSGKVLWSDTLDVVDVLDAFFDIEAAGSVVCGVGIKGDDDGDGGTNAFARCYNRTSGAILWTREFESPCGSSSNIAFSPMFSIDIGLNPAIKIAAGRVLVSFSSFCSSAASSLQSVVIPLSLKDGTNALL